MFFDIPHVMLQVGLNPFPPQTGAHLVQPGPMTHEGLLFEEQNIEEGEKTLASINFMIEDIKGWKHTGKISLVDELRASWNEDMIWWGPAGIGSSYTIERYAEQHSGPFRASFKDRSLMAIFVNLQKVILEVFLDGLTLLLLQQAVLWECLLQKNLEI